MFLLNSRTDSSLWTARTEASQSVSLAAENFCCGYAESFLLEIPRLSVTGQVIAVLGHNGSGKSTLLKALLGLLVPKTGRIIARQARHETANVLLPEKHMAFSPENGAVFADITVESYVQLWCRIKHGNPKYYRREGSRYIDRLEIAPLFKKLGRELSKGQRRRVQTAIGFLTRPSLFLFDEPFDGLDIQQSNMLSDIMLEELDHTAFLLSSHRMDVVEKLADKVIVLNGGRVHAQGTINYVIDQLAPVGFAVSSNEIDPQHLMSVFRLELPRFAIERRGQIVTLAGSQLPQERVRGILRANGMNRVDVVPEQPSLSAAMDFHLKQFA